MKELIGIGLVIAIIYVILNIAGCFNEGVQVARNEFGPKASLEKYEWFKSAANVLKAKKVDIDNYRAVLSGMDSQWGAVAVTEWPRDVRQEYSQRKSELAGIITAFNGLVAEYEAASAKFNWAPYKGRDDLPPTTFQAYN